MPFALAPSAKGRCLPRAPARGVVDRLLHPANGKEQATYNGWPLYTFAEDFVEGDVNGHDFEEFGGEWYLVTPEGGALGEPDEH